MDKMIFQIPAEITKLMTMSNSAIRIQIDTQENINTVMFERLFNLRGQVGWFTFCNREIDPEDIVDLPKAKLPKSEIKTPAQRLRNVIYVLHQQKGGEQKDFENYYNTYMEKLIAHIKEQLDPK